MITIQLPKDAVENALLGKWVEARIPDAYYKDFVTMAAFSDTEGILAVVLYHNFKGTDIEMVLAADSTKWARRDFMRIVINYPFSIGCQRITALTTKGNKTTRKLLTWAGFKQEGKLRRATKAGGDYFIYGLLPDEFRLGSKKQLRKAA